MVICCAALNCTNRQGKVDKSAVSFHRFPLNDSKRLIQWLKAVQRENWTPSKYSFLCSEHFTKDCFAKRQEDQHRLLKPTAVPSIFYFTDLRKAGRGNGKGRKRAAAKVAEEELVVGGGIMVDQSTSTACERVFKLKEESDPQLTPASMVSLDSSEVQSVPSGVLPSRQAFENPAETVGEVVSGPLIESSTQTSVHVGTWMTDPCGVSVDDFTPSASGACKFIGSLHSYSFSSKYARERTSLTREQLERKKAKKDSEPVSSSMMLPERISVENNTTLSFSSVSQKPLEGPTTKPAYFITTSASGVIPEMAGHVGDVDSSHMSINDVITSASGTCKLIDSLHSYCYSSRQSKNQVCFLREQLEKKNAELKLLRQKVSRSDGQAKKLKEKLEELKKMNFLTFASMMPHDSNLPLNSVVEPLSWMLGFWVSEPPGDGSFPTIKPFQYVEEVHISHVGQPMLNFSFNAFHSETKKPLHRECGFIRVKPGTNKVAFISAQNTGIVEVEEGEVNGQELAISSHSIARISFAKEPHVQQIARTFRLTAEGKLEQTVSMATESQPMKKHLHITYKKVSP
ncbi:THAP domain-containing protein 4 isoform X1 [Latimeria chalumnae]|uniref:THAP domain containing 4 n=1 Tax=Latimeria chalumnae TaxID=7897 RepID=H3A8X6_LATCH|nr:PREDICTED: THAP domain-containing protein 4 [Latimeria chalumnae]|eukprot:XP_006005316.1 PREDICTED: THAP domain-containing protein 4 [Latimeria chalumnae]